MCRYHGDDDDYTTFYQTTTRRARKVHSCDECGRDIAAGEQYIYIFQVDEGQPFYHKLCAHCQIGARWLMRNCEGYVYGEVTDEIREHGEEYPALKLPFYRYTVAARRKWKRFDGTGLMPVPQMMPPIDVSQAP